MLHLSEPTWRYENISIALCNKTWGPSWTHKAAIWFRNLDADRQGKHFWDMKLSTYGVLLSPACDWGGWAPTLEAGDPDEKTQLQLTQWGKDNANDHSTIQCSAGFCFRPALYMLATKTCVHCLGYFYHRMPTYLPSSSVFHTLWSARIHSRFLALHCCFRPALYTLATKTFVHCLGSFYHRMPTYLPSSSVVHTLWSARIYSCLFAPNWCFRPALYTKTCVHCLRCFYHRTPTYLPASSVSHTLRSFRIHSWFFALHCTFSEIRFPDSILFFVSFAFL